MRHTIRLGAVLAAFAAAGLALPATAGATQQGNAAAAKDCQKGGFAKYATSTGARFANTGACVQHAASGGVLVPLPDLVATASCTVSGPTFVGTKVFCAISVKNQGIGPATGRIAVDASLTLSSPQPSSFTATIDATGCGNAAGSVSTNYFARVSEGSVTCDGPLAPGASLDVILELDVVGTPPGSATLVATADRAQVVTEANEANNTLTRTFSL